MNRECRLMISDIEFQKRPFGFKKLQLQNLTQIVSPWANKSKVHPCMISGSGCISHGKDNLPPNCTFPFHKSKLNIPDNLDKFEIFHPPIVTLAAWCSLKKPP